MIVKVNRWMGTSALGAMVLLHGCGISLPEARKDQSLQVGDHGFVVQEVLDTVDHCDPMNMSGYESAPPLARRIAEGTAWDLEDETAALALIDSFKLSRDHAFYRAILLRSIEKADGFYAEPLGLALQEDVLEHPCSWLSCCWENGCDGELGLKRWAFTIAGEFLIADEEDPWSAFVDYGQLVEARANEHCDLQTRSRTHEFLDEIGQHLKQKLERDSPHD